MAFWITDEGKKHIKGKRCYHCGKELTFSSDICPYCKTDNSKAKQKIATSHNEEIECPKCMTLNPPDNVLCQSCGENLVALKSSKIKDYSVMHQVDKKRKH